MPATDSPALDLILPIVRCPVCEAALARDGSTLRCPNRHSFDIARQGYVSLLTGTKPTSGDDAAMVRARQQFLEGGAFAPIRAAISDLATGTPRPPTTVVEVGCGTGYYLAGVLEALPAARGLGLDSSARALRIAAKAHPRAAAATWDAFRPFPLASASVDLMLDVFAPRNPPEFHRVLHPEGRLIVARPDEGHLADLRRQIGEMVGIDPIKEERLHQALDPHFEVIDTERVEYTASLSRGNVLDLLAMTPSARHLSAEDLTRVAAGDLPEEVTVSVLASAYRPRT
jgi:23S rRNA (guanine745-N1)-methyltransferase